jgi:hypothetical protein
VACAPVFLQIPLGWAAADRPHRSSQASVVGEHEIDDDGGRTPSASPLVLLDPELERGIARELFVPRDTRGPSRHDP